MSAGYYDAYYGRATLARQLIRQDYDQVFDQTKTEGVDVVMTPTTPTPAWTIGAKSGDPLQTYLEDIFTVPANLAGIPAISIPQGKSKAGLPVGVQLCAGHFREDKLFQLGKIIENLK